MLPVKLISKPDHVVGIKYNGEIADLKFKLMTDYSRWGIINVIPEPSMSDNTARIFTKDFDLVVFPGDWLIFKDPKKYAYYNIVVLSERTVNNLYTREDQ